MVVVLMGANAISLLSAALPCETHLMDTSLLHN